jgi:hypothetical protein
MASGKKDERWKELCEAIARELDSERLMDLVKKLNRVLEKRENEQAHRKKK